MKKAMILAVIITVVAGGFLIVRQLTPVPAKDDREPEAIPTVVLPTVPDSIKVELEATSDKRAVQLKISGLTKEIESVEYELTYTTGAGLPRGVLGKITSKGEEQISRDNIVLGTCSSGKCVYDSGVTSVDLSLKFNSGEESRVFRKTYLL